MRVSEKYEQGELEGELMYEVVDNARIPFVLASKAPDLHFPDYQLSGVFVFSQHYLRAY